MLTADELKHFEDEGYLLFEALLQGDALQRHVDVFDGLVKGGRDLPVDTPHYTFEKDEDGKPVPGFMHKIQGVCEVEPRVLALAREPVILDRIEALVGPDIDVFGTKFFPKLPNGGTSTHWHQDNYYFGTTSDRIVSCAIYLQDSSRENGCLRLIPRSHLTATIAAHQSNPLSYGSWVDLDDSDALDVDCPAGTVVFFSANLLHGAYDNHSDRTRYSTAWHYLPGDLSLKRFPRGGYGDRHTVRGK
ncbi:MAG: phytanoyl-CoA dioxygenase family protein [Planctomycetota bacterium]|nr:phytanoyl-CoA dioxygenase family protein [Planctomycetota bacterium]